MANPEGYALTETLRDDGETTLCRARKTGDASRVLSPSVVPELNLQRLGNGEEGIEVDLLRHQSHLKARRHRVLVEVNPEELHRP